MKIAERIVMVVLLLVLLAGVIWIYFAVQYEQQEVRDAVARGEYEIPLPNEEGTPVVAETDWRTIYTSTEPMVIGSTTVNASIADTLPERIKGLSGTPFLPDDVVKLFVFGSPGKHSIWMKDMNYAIDIIWTDREGEIVHIEENVSPDTFPESFSPDVDTWYVVETAAGFVSTNKIEIGNNVALP